NSLWHLDGHHKLIMWGIIIHGVIDGYCHTVCSCTLVQKQLFLKIFDRSQHFVLVQIIEPPSFLRSLSVLSLTLNTYETVPLGRQGGKGLHIALPDHVWRLREIVWCQALEVLMCIRYLID
ncbi:hypothetical protein PILCRDRAFT_79976, partial [Piloderma croceum F 1598]